MSHKTIETYFVNKDNIDSFSVKDFTDVKKDIRWVGTYEDFMSAKIPFKFYVLYPYLLTVRAFTHFIKTKGAKSMLKRSRLRTRKLTDKVKSVWRDILDGKVIEAVLIVILTILTFLIFFGNGGHDVKNYNGQLGTGNKSVVLNWLINSASSQS